MQSVNKVILLGVVGRDPEVRTVSTGKKFVNLSLATSETWNDKQSGERKERTEWSRISIMNDRIAGFVEQYVRKGSKLYVEGSLQTRKWTDQSGQEKFSTEVVVGPFKGEVVLVDGAQRGEAQRQDAPSQRSGGKQYGGEESDLDSEIPF